MVNNFRLARIVFSSYSLLLRICHTLKSRAREVRDAARDTLAKIAVSLGAQYFSFVLKELRSSLTRGYQVILSCMQILCQNFVYALDL